MNLSENPEIVVWPETHYVFVERVGPFQDNAPQAWQSLHQVLGGISEHNKITGFISLYKVGPQVYRAGVSVAGEPENLSDGVTYMHFHGGKYSKFVLTGPYSDLQAASMRVFQIAAEKKIRQRNDFCIENYVNDPRTTEEQKLITEILIPTE